MDSGNYISPWKREDAFPEKPVDKEYGYLHRRKLVGCSREELIAKCKSREHRQVHLVWHPESPRLVPPIEVEFLFDALKDRRTYELRIAIVIGMLNLVMWLGIALLAKNSSSRSWLYMMAVLMGLIPLGSGAYGLHQLRKTPSANENEISAGRYQSWVLAQPIILTWLLVGMLVLIYIVQNFVGLEASINAAGLDKKAVWRGEWWRIFTAPLLHAGAIHVMFNISTMLGLGRMMEVLASRYLLAIVFGISAVVGSIFSLLMLDATSVGASGGLLGLIGFLAILGERQKQSLPPGFAKSLVFNVALLAALGIVAFSIIDNAAHLGGFVAGITLGYVFVPKTHSPLPLVPERGMRRVGILAFFLTVAAAAFSVFKMLSK